MPPSVNALKSALEQWAREGATGVLFEWENMFPYPGLEGAVRPDAYTRPEIDRIIERCRALQLQAVPLMQTLGHLEWLLSGPAFAHLREGADDPRLIRACDPEATDLLLGQIDALLDAHPGSPYIHLGGDEARGLENVDRPECSSVRDGAATVFLRHMRPLLDRVIRAGKRPIVWSDMPLHYPERLKDFPRETVFCDWLYRTDAEHGPTVRDWAYGHLDQARLAEVPAKRRALFEPYWALDAPDYPRRFYQHPYTPFLRDQGFDVIGASAVIYAEYPLTVPSLPHARANGRLWLRTVRRFGGLGTVNTCWAIRGALREVTAAGHRAFLHMGGHPETAGDDAAVAEAVWKPVAGAEASRLAAEIEAFVPPFDPLTRTAPFRYDPATGMNRPVPFDERRAELLPALKEMDDTHPEVETHRNAIRQARRIKSLFGTLETKTPEIEGWMLSLREAALRAEVWLALRDAARGGATDPGRLRDLRSRIEKQADALGAFMSERYPPSDIDIVRRDRYDGLLRLLK